MKVIHYCIYPLPTNGTFMLLLGSILEALGIGLKRLKFETINIPDSSMALIDVQLPNSLARALRLPKKSPRRQQIKVLKKLLKKARFTEFGQQYHFDRILLNRHAGKKFSGKCSGI